MPTRNIGPCECCGEDEPTYVDVTCLSACEKGTPFGCPVEQLPTAWCIDPLGSPSGTSVCPWLFTNGTVIVGDPCVFCVWGMQAINLFFCNGSPTFEECNNFQITGTIACAGVGYSGDCVSDLNTEHGMYINISLFEIGAPFPAEGLYFIEAGSFDCTGPNTLTKVDECSFQETFPATITISPCSHEGVCFDSACD